VVAFGRINNSLEIVWPNLTQRPAWLLPVMGQSLSILGQIPAND
jgi:hypothetical protein